MELASVFIGILLCMCAGLFMWIFMGQQLASGDRYADMPLSDRRRYQESEIVRLNGTNYANWQYMLRLALRRLRVEYAIQRPLAINSEANQTALARITGSLDDRHLSMVRDTLTAYEAYEKISKEYVTNDVVKQALVERDIRSIKLDGFTEAKVREYTLAIGQKIDDLRMAGADLTSERELCLYVDGLPDELVPFKASTYQQLATLTRDQLLLNLTRYCGMLKAGQPEQSLLSKEGNRYRPNSFRRETRNCHHCGTLY